MIVLKNHIFKHLEKSCSQSSVKGVGRIIKTKDKVLKAIWTAGVVTLLVICLLNVYDVIRRYLTYPTSTTMKDTLVSSEQMRSSFLLGHVPPDATFCNLNPFRSNHEVTAEKENIPTISNYLQQLENFKQSHPNIHEAFFSKLDSLMGYYQYLGPENAAKISHSADDFIVDCKILVFTPFGFETLSCDRERQIKHYMTAEFFSCYTIGFTPEMTEDMRSRGIFILGIEAIICLDNFDTTAETFFMLRNSGAGATVAVHEHATIFVPELDSVPVGVGTETSIRLQWELRERLGAPYGNCLQEDKQVWSVDGKQYKYNLVACVATCIQEIVRSECGCLMGLFVPTATFTNLSVTPYCLDMKEPSELISNRSECMLRTTKSNHSYCSKCHPLCREYRYKKSSFSTKWPRKGQQIPFYNKYIKGSSREEKFAMYEHIKQLHKQGNLTEANNLLHQTTLIEDNFAKVSVYLTSVDVLIVQDHVTVSLFDLLAKIGGSLNLYSGISCIVIVEMIDFFYNILVTYGRKETKEEASITKVSPVFSGNYFVTTA